MYRDDTSNKMSEDLEKDNENDNDGQIQSSPTSILESVVFLWLLI